MKHFENKATVEAEVPKAGLTDKELQEIGNAYKWAMAHKSKREIMQLCMEIHIRYEVLKLELEKLKEKK